MLTGWRPVEITCTGNFASGQEVTFTVVLDGVVTDPRGAAVAISTNFPDFFVLLPESVTVKEGSDSATFPAQLAAKHLPPGLYVSVSSDGGTLHYPNNS